MKKTQIMYIEEKGGLTGSARIGRVSFSKTGKTLYYKDCAFQSLDGRGYKANYYDANSYDEETYTCDWYWVSGCRKDGEDTLYPDTVDIDDDVRVEYWTEIREQPERKHETSYYSKGTHHGWRRQQFKR